MLDLTEEAQPDSRLKTNRLPTKTHLTPTPNAMTEPASALLPFLLQAAFISLSGVMAPGPLGAAR